ncbi:pyridoxamine 5'-phosphate oxidase [Planctomycetota bacterium]
MPPKDIGSPPLTDDQLDPNPLHQFKLWYEQAQTADLAEPHAMILATATPQGKPGARIVLLRGLNDQGLEFYTNYQSRKTQEITVNAQVGLTFYWMPLHRQVRIEGIAHELSSAESDHYFQQRPHASKVGAWASQQSTVIPDREHLESRVFDLEQRYLDQPIPRPPHCGGYRVVPTVFEFWQEQPHRLHDRLRHTRQADSWLIERLAP